MNAVEEEMRRKTDPIVRKISRCQLSAEHSSYFDHLPVNVEETAM